MPDDSAQPETASDELEERPAVAIPVSWTDRRRSGGDQAAAERDAARAAADRRAAVRDEHAAKRASAAHSSTNAKLHAAMASVQADQAGAAADREAAAAERALAARDRANAAEDRRRASEDREEARIELREAHLDDLTGFYRPGLGLAVLRQEIDRCRRSSGRLVLAYCDVDGLKQMNDERGHAAGDAVLRSLAAALRSGLRSYDPVVRIGGDEFVCALSDTDVEQAERAFEDVKGVLARAMDGASVSVGLVALLPDDDLTSLLDRGDQALRDARAVSPPARDIR